MIRQSKLTLATLALLLSALMPVGADAQPAPNFARQHPAPKVVFIGDYFTYEWTSAFAANPNWINQGNPDTRFGLTSGWPVIRPEHRVEASRAIWVLDEFQSS
jgi:hypothetical protein